jgi:Leucine-rich repeat (LRR) protein
MMMGNNNLTELPSSFSDLANIKKLFLNNNQLIALPDDFGNLETLDILELGANNISELPESIGDLPNMSVFAVMSNNLTALPESFGTHEIDSVFLHDNQITELPVALFDNTFDIFVIQENNLQFGSIEPFMDNDIDQFYYTPQAMIGQDTIIELVENETFEYTIEVTGENNIYKWYKDGILQTDQITNTLYFENASLSDQGTYVLKVTNSIVPDLELTSYNIIISILTGTEDFESSSIQVFPNPASGNTISVKGIKSDEVKRVQILSITGQVMNSWENPENLNHLDVTKLERGMYILRVLKTDGSLKNVKFLVN